MLDSFEVLTTSGVVLWSRSYAPVSSTVINGLIKHVFIEEQTATNASATETPPYKKDHYTVKWTTAEDLKLIFVVCGSTLPSRRSEDRNEADKS